MSEIEEFVVMVGTQIRGFVQLSDDGYNYSSDGIRYTRLGGSKSDDVVPFNRRDYRLVAI